MLWSSAFPHWWLVTRFVIRVTRQGSLVVLEVSSIPVLRGVRVAQSLVFCVVFFDHCSSFIPFLLTIVCLFVFFLFFMTSSYPPLVSSIFFCTVWYIYYFEILKFFIRLWNAPKNTKGIKTITKRLKSYFLTKHKLFMTYS